MGIVCRISFALQLQILEKESIYFAIEEERKLGCLVYEAEERKDNTQDAAVQGEVAVFGGRLYVND